MRLVGLGLVVCAWACWGVGGVRAGPPSPPTAQRSGATEGKPGASTGGTANPVREDLQHLKRDLNRERRVFSRLQHESTSLLATLQELDAEVEQADEELVETEKQLAEVERKLAESERMREQAAESLSALRARLGRRLRQIYMQGELGWLDLIFGADSISEALQGYELAKRLAIADERLARQVARSRDRIVETQLRITQQKSDLERARAQVEQRRVQAAAARDEQLAAVDLVRRRAGLHRRAMSELKRARGRLSNLVASMEGRAPTAKGFATWRGRLPSPVKGAKLEAGFGKQVDERFGTVTINQGVDLRAPLGTPVKAVYPGKVVYAQTFRGYGRLVILDHGGGYYTLYGHLDRIRVAKGDKVGQAEPVGTLGQSGSLKGPYLYFEVRRGGKAQDPAGWVRF